MSQNGKSSILEKVLSRFARSDAPPGWATLGIVYFIWFTFHPAYITFLGIPVATKLVEAAEKDFWCKNANELANTARSLAVFAFFYVLVPTTGTADEIYPYISALRAGAFAIGIIFFLLYVWLKEKQRFMYYQTTLRLIMVEENPKFDMIALGEEVLFFWDGKLVASAVAGSLSSSKRNAPMRW